MKYLIYEKTDGTVILKQERECWALPYPTIAAAIDGIRELPIHKGATILVVDLEGKPKLQFTL